MRLASPSVESDDATSTTSTFLAACRKQDPTSMPVWFMRQAGRSLPEYREVRGTGDILTAIRNPELVAEITIQPVRRHGVDAAVLYSDIMVPLEAIGFGVEIKPGVGPVVAEPFKTEADLERIRPLDAAGDTPFVLDAIKLLTQELSVPLIGFAGAPFTLAAYLVEGGPSKSYSKVKSLMFSRPDLWTSLMERLSAMCVASLRSQVDAGCAAIQLFDSWAGQLSLADYERYVLPHSRFIFESMKDAGVPMVHFGVGTGELLTAMSQAGCDVIGIDWRVSLSEARRRVGDLVMQGNLDPASCTADWPVIQARVDSMLDEIGDNNHVFNLGHGVLPETPPENLTRLVEYVHGRTFRA